MVGPSPSESMRVVRLGPHFLSLSLSNTGYGRTAKEELSDPVSGLGRRPVTGDR